MSLLGGSSSEYAAYQLGKQSAELDALTQDAIGSVLGPRSPAIDVSALVAQSRVVEAENARLKAELEAVRHELANYKHNYARLSEWADEAEAKLKRHGL